MIVEAKGPACYCAGAAAWEVEDRALGTPGTAPESQTFEYKGQCQVCAVCLLSEIVAVHAPEMRLASLLARVAYNRIARKWRNWQTRQT
jgi:hypothetical protein